MKLSARSNSGGFLYLLQTSLGFAIIHSRGDFMRKFSIVILACLLILTMTACGQSRNFDNEEALFDLGIEVTKTMQEMVYSDEYISLYSAVEFEDEIVKFQATDYDSPIAVYSVEIPNVKDVLSKLPRKANILSFCASGEVCVFHNFNPPNLY